MLQGKSKLVIHQKNLLLHSGIFQEDIVLMLNFFMLNFFLLDQIQIFLYGSTYEVQFCDPHN